MEGFDVVNCGRGMPTLYVPCHGVQLTHGNDDQDAQHDGECHARTLRLSVIASTGGLRRRAAAWDQQAYHNGHCSERTLLRVPVLPLGAQPTAGPRFARPWPWRAAALTGHKFSISYGVLARGRGTFSHRDNTTTQDAWACCGVSPVSP